MCRLCGDKEERESRLEEIGRTRRLLRELDYLLGEVVRGKIKPHTDEMKKIVKKERSIVRDLIMDVL